ncbi:MAG: hypothetical protein RSB05_08495, partial [Clostridiales bacterium]
TKKIRRNKEHHLMGALTIISLLLTVGLGVIFSTVAKGLPMGTAEIQGYGAILLWGAADAYVLIGVLAFTAGAIITALCIRSQRGKKTQRGNHSNTENKR